MEGEILITISSIATATKATIEAVRAALAKGKASQETLALVSDLQTRILQLHDIAFRLHEEKVQAVQAKNEALEENRQLRADIRRKEEGAADRDRYETRHVGQSMVVTDKQNPKVYLCPTCFEAGPKVYLSPLPSVMAGIVGTHNCPKCQTIFTLR